MSDKTVMIFGSTGAIGTGLAEIISKNQPGWTVLAVSRSGGAKSRLASMDLPNVKLIKGNVEDTEDVKRLMSENGNVDMVYCCVGFAEYERKYWAQHWPLVLDSLLACTSEARPLVFCDNLYAYGSPGDVPINTSTPTLPPSMKSKPNIRAVMRQRFQKRMDESPKSIAVVGGSDFFGPFVTDKSFLGDSMVKNMLEGSKPLAVGNTNKVHDFCFAKDFSNALYVASIHDSAFGRFWICPHSVHDMSVQSIANLIHTLILPKTRGSPVAINAIPGFVVRMLSPFVPLMAELSEMLGIWTKDYMIDDSEFCKEFGVVATPKEEALKELIDFYVTKLEKNT